MIVVANRQNTILQKRIITLTLQRIRLLSGDGRRFGRDSDPQGSTVYCLLFTVYYLLIP